MSKTLRQGTKRGAIEAENNLDAPDVRDGESIRALQHVQRKTASKEFINGKFAEKGGETDFHKFFNIEI